MLKKVLIFKVSLLRIQLEKKFQVFDAFFLKSSFFFFIFEHVTQLYLDSWQPWQMRHLVKKPTSSQKKTLSIIKLFVPFRPI